MAVLFQGKSLEMRANKKKFSFTLTEFFIVSKLFPSYFKAMFLFGLDFH